MTLQQLLYVIAIAETGWEIPEAITLYETGKGNCYCYAGVFLSLARGLGYNAVNVLMRLLPSGIANALIGTLYAK